MGDRGAAEHQEEAVVHASRVSDQLHEIGFTYGTTADNGRQKVARHIKPSHSAAQSQGRVDFICDQVDETTGYFLDEGNVIHVDESGFSIMKSESSRLRTSPGRPGYWVQNSHVPKILLIVPNVRPDPTTTLRARSASGILAP